MRYSCSTKLCRSKIRLLSVLSDPRSSRQNVMPRLMCSPDDFIPDYQIGITCRQKNVVISSFSPFSIMFPKGFFLRLVQPITRQTRLLTIQKKKAFENFVGKGEKAGNQDFLQISQCFRFLTVFPLMLKTEVIIWATFILLCANALKLVWYKILSFFKELTLSQTTSFRLYQTKRVCIRQFQIWWKWQKVTQVSGKHLWKRRNYLFRAISSFPTEVSKDF